MSGGTWEARSAVVMAATAVIGLVVSLVGIFQPFGGDNQDEEPENVSRAGSDSSGSKGTDVVPSCYGQYFKGIATGRVTSLEEGAFEVPFLGQGEALDQPAGIRFTSGGTHIGAMRFQFFPAGAVFKIETVVNTRCGAIDEYVNETHSGSSKGTLLYNDDMRVVFNGSAYRFHFRDGGTYFKLTFTRAS